MKHKTLLISILIFIPVLLYWIATSNQPIIDSYNFRQAQTAITARYLFEDSSSLLNYHTPVLGKPWAIPFEFPTYQALAKLTSNFTQISITQTGRLLNSLMTLSAISACICILRSSRIKLLYTTFFIFLVATSHIYLYWGRSFMIEGTALFFTAIAGLIYIRSRVKKPSSVCNQLNSKIWETLPLLSFTFCILMGSLTKVTTSIPLIGFILLDQIILTIKTIKSHDKINIRNIYFTLVALSSVIITKIWVNHADSLKILNSNATHTLSKNLTSWNFGTLAQRLEFWRWKQLCSHFTTTDSNLALMLPASIILIALSANILHKRRDQKETSEMIYVANFGLFMFLAGPLLFFNLYFEHSYYFTANLIFGYLSMVASLGTIAKTINFKPYQKALDIIFIMLIATTCALQLHHFVDVHLAISQHKTSDALKISQTVQDMQSSDDRLITIETDSWSSQLFYLTNLKGLSVQSAYWLNERYYKEEILKLFDNNTASLFIITKRNFSGELPKELQAKRKNLLGRANCQQIGSNNTYLSYKCQPFM